MISYFHLSTKLTLFFEDFKIKNTSEFLVSLVFVFTLSLLAECARNWEQFLRFSILLERGTGGNNALSKKQKITRHGLTSLLHMMQLLLGYFVMLALMTYNVMILMVVMLGFTLGYFLSAPLLTNNMNKLYSKQYLDTNGKAKQACSERLVSSSNSTETQDEVNDVKEHESPA